MMDVCSIGYVFRYLHKVHLTSTAGRKYSLERVSSLMLILMHLSVPLPTQPIILQVPAEWARLTKITWWWLIHCAEWWGWNVFALWMRQSCQVLSVATSMDLSLCWLRRLQTWSLAVLLRHLLPPAFNLCFCSILYQECLCHRNCTYYPFIITLFWIIIIIENSRTIMLLCYRCLYF